MLNFIFRILGKVYTSLWINACIWIRGYGAGRWISTSCRCGCQSGVERDVLLLVPVVTVLRFWIRGPVDGLSTHQNGSTIPTFGFLDSKAIAECYNSGDYILKNLFSTIYSWENCCIEHADIFYLWTTVRLNAPPFQFFYFLKQTLFPLVNNYLC